MPITTRSLVPTFEICSNQIYVLQDSKLQITASDRAVSMKDGFQVLIRALVSYSTCSLKPEGRIDHK